MTETVKGKVDRVHKGQKAYSALIDEVWYGCGFEEPTNFKQGDTVQFVVRRAPGRNGKDFLNMELSTLEVLDVAPVGTMKPAKDVGEKVPWKVGAKSSAAAEKNKYFEEKSVRDLVTQKEIRLQASRNTATAFVDVLLKAGALKLPAKDANKVGVIEAALAHYTELFYNQTGAVADKGVQVVYDEPATIDFVKDREDTRSNDYE